MESLPSSQLRFLSGGGEMGERIRAFPWIHTPLGPIEKWPQSLKTSISLMLNSQHPIWIGWGPDATFLYNDAYIQVLSLAKHPSALGAPAAEVWKEIWDFCGPLADKVFQKGEPSFVNDVQLFMSRGDFLEETFYSFSYSPIRDESGNIGGLFCPSAEVTSKVLTTRRLETLSQLAAESLTEKSPHGACASSAAILAKNHADIPFALLYLIDSEGKLASLERAIGIPEGQHLLSPKRLQLIGSSNEAEFWPIGEVARTGQLQIMQLKDIEGLPLGSADQSISEVMVVPLISRGQERPLGIMVAGVNPARRVDPEYRTFYELVASHIATAIQNARVNEEEKRRADALTELDRAKTIFFSNVSHELRTPLTLILGPLEDELRESTIPNERLELIHRNSLRLLKLVNTLLDFSRIEAGRMEISFEPTDLATFTAELVSVFRSGIERAGLRLLLDCPPLAQPVYVDRNMWEKIVFNLLSNALKYTARGEIEVKLGVAQDIENALGKPFSQSSNSWIYLLVRDTGIGIAEKELPRVFDRFHRIKNTWARSHEGTGIGLALVQELARLHGGRVEVESVESAGTTFRVWIPQAPAQSAPELRPITPKLHLTSSGGLPDMQETLEWLPQKVVKSSSNYSELTKAEMETLYDSAPVGSFTCYEAEKTSNEAQQDFANGRIILADDNNDMRGYIYRLLTSRGYHVTAVADGQAALEAVRALSPSLVLSDVMMPRLDGFELLRELRNDPATKAIPIILLSARAGEEARIEGIGAGADDYLTKPFSARELLARVTTHMELARSRREATEAVRQREERLLRVLDSITDGLAVLDKDWCFTYCSEQGGRIVGIRPEKLIGGYVWDIFPHAKGTKFYDEAHRATESGESVHFEEYYPEPLNKWIECHCYPSEEGLSVYFHDISDRKNAENALHLANVQLADKATHLEMLVQQRTTKLSETIGELEAFSYSIAHDMRAPLRSLQGYSDILLQDYHDKLDTEGQRFLQRIAASARRMDKLIQDVLSYSRVVSGDLSLEKVDLEPLLYDIIDTYPALATDKADISLQGSFPTVLGNEAMLMQIFSNLIGNAAKFTFPGVKPQISVWTEAQPPHVRILVQDNGIGIAPDQQNKIFDIFQQVDRDVEGTGIGLAIVKKAVERLGGKIGLKSELHHGSTFWIELQLANSDL